MDIEDKTLIEVRISAHGVKYINFIGYGYCCGEPDDKPYRWVEYTGLTCLMNDALKYGIAQWESDHQCLVNQYIKDLSEEEYNSIERHPILEANTITEDLPCGLYYIQ